MKNSIMLIAAIFVLVVSYGFTGSQLQEEPAGKKLFVDQKCSNCHSVDAEGITSKAKKKNDLSGIGTNYTKEVLAGFLTKTTEIDGKKHSMKFKGTEAELSELSAWLETLKAEEGKEGTETETKAEESKK